ncbi:cache domain-containing protein [Paenibacillus agricola]|uniref:Double Cache domain-containing protein n=1 Tax=Paenibacillus agricola TaxID=2716264 RepID=A0ABX0JBD6_9BACL|nr:cache domain-containing protein [Paenibacillus agricola]NHN33800.1 hypothetical protein [Paenibacillus agricola]
MSLSRKITTILLIVVLVTSSLITYVFYRQQVGLQEVGKRELMDMVSGIIQNKIGDQAGFMLGRASMIAEIPTVKKAVRNRDRDALIAELTETAKLQKSMFGILQWAFYTPTSNSILYMYDQQKPTEDVSAYREMINAASRNKEPLKGVEIGPAGAGIRGVIPIMDGAGLSGVMELSLDFSKFGVEIKKNTGFDVGVFVDDELMTRVAKSVPSPEKQYIMGGLRNIQYTDWNLVSSIVTPELLKSTTELTFYDNKLGGINYGSLMFPLVDFSGKKIGVIVATKSMAIFDKQIQKALIIAMMLLVFQVIVLTGAVLLITRGMLINPFMSLRKAVEEEGNETGKELAARTDEIGAIAKKVLQLKTHLNHSEENQKK